ncbi:uncharacterized protein EV422DRAFT_542225 [Fimicolochytrium jonesii]|uniref:uncharacterized protein n=1 Tax=Fimicolochytrium jonesii TaxID=1396493 RepID=UPI0022FE07A9|nr:uncharacterized protein EV422DRAFT_542225 [Fimicolochytrium jonesii]KAI8817272.1 hypothetical protein EV422DRAFT_542225 [Fimicolochytrium jonesii]
MAATAMVEFSTWIFNISTKKQDGRIARWIRDGTGQLTEESVEEIKVLRLDQEVEKTVLPGGDGAETGGGDVGGTRAISINQERKLGHHPKSGPSEPAFKIPPLELPTPMVAPVYPLNLPSEKMIFWNLEDANADKLYLFAHMAWCEECGIMIGSGWKGSARKAKCDQCRKRVSPTKLDKHKLLVHCQNLLQKRISGKFADALKKHAGLVNAHVVDYETTTSKARVLCFCLGRFSALGCRGKGAHHHRDTSMRVLEFLLTTTLPSTHSVLAAFRDKWVARAEISACDYLIMGAGTQVDPLDRPYVLQNGRLRFQAPVILSEPRGLMGNGTRV